MKKLILDHTFTPSQLKRINQDLADLTVENDPDESNFLKFVTQRDEFIQDYLIKLPEKDKNNFVNAELIVNGALVAYAEASFKASLNQLSGLVRGRKAVNKYR